VGFPIVPRQRDAVATTVPIRRLIHLLVFTGALAIPEAAQADCTPAFSSGQPPAGTTVTCTGTTDGNPAGYGDSTQTGLTINVAPTATVEGTTNGFALNTNNTITNDGTISDDGANMPDVNGISAVGTLALTALSSTPFTIKLQTLDGTGANGALASWDGSSNHTWFGIATTTGVTGFASSDFNVDTTGFANLFPGQFSVVLDADGTSLDLAYSSVPEPSAFLSLGLGMVGLVTLRRFRRLA